VSIHPQATPGSSRDAAFTLLELLIVVAIIGILAAIAIPRLVRMRTTANEAAAIASIRAIATAEEVYSRTCGDGGFAVTLTTLGQSTPGSSAPFLSPDLTISSTPRSEGYTFELAAGAGASAGPDDCNGTGTQSAFYATAAPATIFISGTRAFAVSTRQMIWELPGATPPTEPFGAPATPLR
jgi:prepilin-type N-terminal cleavage/methylation domain-containing protein